MDELTARGSRLLVGYLSESELAAELRRHKKTVKRWRDLGIGPPYAMNGREVIYSEDEARAWLRAGGVAGAQRRRKTRRR